MLVAAQEDAESDRVADLLGDMIAADLRARRAFTITRVWMAGTVSIMTWVALVVGVLLAVRGDIRAGS